LKLVKFSSEKFYENPSVNVEIFYTSACSQGQTGRAILLEVLWVYERA